MESSEVRVSTQDQLATAVIQAAMTQHLEQFRQQILTEVSDQMRVVDEKINTIKSRSREESDRRDIQFQELKEQSQAAHCQTDAKLDALMSAMAALTHSKGKDT